MMQKNSDAMQPTDLSIGTVTSASPLEITISTAMPPLPASVLYLTSAVVEKKMPMLEHTHKTGGLQHEHTIPSGSTGPALSGEFESSKELTSVAVMENGKPLPVKGGYIILNRGLETGDKVLLLRVQKGQKFIVLSRVFEKEA